MVIFSGRVVKRYIQKDIIFLLLSNEDSRLRCIIKNNEKKKVNEFKKQYNIGNILSVEGIMQSGRDGKEELLVENLKVIAQTKLEPFETGIWDNSKFTGVKEKQYYHTLMLNDFDAICYLKARSAVVQGIHNFFQKKNFCNLKTPVLQHNFYAGGARPFITHMLDSDTDMYLHITSEVAIKLMLAGGLSKVYEMGEYFRNGSIDEMHSVPFSALEAYQTEISYNEMQLLANELFYMMGEAIDKVLKKYGKKITINIKKQIPELTFNEFIKKSGYPNFEMDNLSTYPEIEELKEKSKDMIRNSKVLYNWFKNSLIQKQKEPVWVSDLPFGQSPFIKRKGEYYLFRKYLIVNGATLAEVAQSEREAEIIEKNLMLQQKYQNNLYPHDYKPFIHAYKLGMPDMSSLFFSIDRLYPAFTGTDNINKYKMYI